MNEPPSIALIINTWNAPDRLDGVLRWLANGTRWPEELIIADDGSTEETGLLIGDWSSRVPCPLVHAWQEDCGYRRARVLNLAIAKSRADYLVIIDGDCLPLVHFITDHRKLAERGTFVQGRRCFVPQSKVNRILTGKTSLARLLFTGQLGGPMKAIRWPLPIIRRNRDLRGVLGCNLGIWREDLVAVNGFDEAFEGWGAEDSELAARLYHLGRERKFVYGRAQLAHLNHDPLSRERYENNQRRLEITLKEERIRCEWGLDRHPTIAARPTTNPTQAITFDAVGTLIVPHPSVGEVYAEVLAELGVTASAADLEKRFRESFRSLKTEAPNAVLNRDRWRQIVLRTIDGLGPAERFDELFDALWNAFADPRRWRTLPGVEASLAKLQSRRYRLFVLSNNDERLPGILDGLGIGTFFEAVFVSAELGAEKPSREIFRRVEVRTGLRSDQILHAGDSLAEDVAGAINAGWQSALIGRPAGDGSPQAGSVAADLVDFTEQLTRRGENFCDVQGF